MSRPMPATDRYWVYAGLSYAWTNTGNQFTFAVTAGGSLLQVRSQRRQISAGQLDQLTVH